MPGPQAQLIHPGFGVPVEVIHGLGEQLLVHILQGSILMECFLLLPVDHLESKAVVLRLYALWEVMGNKKDRQLQTWIFQRASSISSMFSSLGFVRSFSRRRDMAVQINCNHLLWKQCARQP